MGKRRYEVGDIVEILVGMREREREQKELDIAGAVPLLQAT